MKIKLNKIHIGEAIKKRLDDKKITKSEFARRIGVPQQHVNRIFERDTIEVKRLMTICEALDYNFFALFCELPKSVSAYMAAVATDGGNATNLVGDAAVAAEMEIAKEKVRGLERERDLLTDQVRTLKDNVEQLKSQLADKERLINLISK